MKYAYEDLSPEQFERLIVFLCQELFGIATQGFSKGPDGGRDAKFVGTAERFPSAAKPWEGTTIIQAKHTNGYNGSCSDADFLSANSQDTVIGKEIPRIKKLRESGSLDHYMLITNRRLSGNAEEKIRSHLAEKCNIPTSSISLCGIEGLEMWLKKFPSVAEYADIDPIDSPLIISSDELAEVIEALAAHKNALVEVDNHPPVPRVSYEQKNQLNNMSKEYAKAQRQKYLKETRQIQVFLANPENQRCMQLYESVVDEFQLSIIANRKDYQTFDQVMEYITRMLLDRDVVLRQSKRLTRAVLFYMYWYCDIGETDDATSD